ncbi:MAG: 3-oxoacyl-ACP reductase [Desulfobacterales bacterium RIFOXYA12_FULL_46_15]|nr:MAG: 3-oxoacyl-ACP reductase [Desulfobacula sp. GWF2_41_7]OGR26107.1 MAG: 3-oxoacyl-ACP reductase [Desulfobacterales bacterium RIFOXYA12_FULL_46_15]
MRIKGKVALVLGAVKGIGKEIGLALAAEGAKLALTRYDWTDDFCKMEEDFKKTGTEHTIFTVDLRNNRDIHRLTAEIEEKYGCVDIFINNIERGGWPSVHGEYNEDQWDLEIETTLKAKRWVFASVFPLLKKADEAVVINISSIAAIVGRSGPAALVFNDGYAAANKGVSTLTETWARMGAPTIRVNEIMLGLFDGRHAKNTRGWQEALTENEKKALIDHILLGRTGKSEDLIKTILFLIKDAAYMTGSVIRLDGGYVLGGERVPRMPEGIL